MRAKEDMSDDSEIAKWKRNFKGTSRTYLLGSERHGMVGILSSSSGHGGEKSNNSVRLFLAKEEGRGRERRVAALRGTEEVG